MTIINGSEQPTILSDLEQRMGQGRALIESGANVVDGNDPAHRPGQFTQGQESPFLPRGLRKTGPRDAQVEGHGKAVLESAR